MAAEPADAPPSWRPQPTAVLSPYDPVASLYVGDLDPQVSERDLVTIFQLMGPISSLRLCRDFHTGESLRYAYVNFFFYSHASKAIACLNHTEVKGRTMRIMWSQRDPLSRKSGVGNLFVKNLDRSITSAKLQDLFSKYGNLLSCKVAEENGTSKGFGFVHFDSEVSAMAAITALHNETVLGKKLYVSKFVKRSVRTAANEERASTDLFVKNLDYNITEHVLQEKFSEFGKVSKVTILKDSNDNSRGFGFVKFELHKDANNAVEKLNGSLLGSKHLFMERARKKVGRKLCNCQFEKFKATNNLCVKNLDLSVNDAKLRDHFSCCGEVISVRVMRCNDGTSKGYGFVCFSTHEEAMKALHTLNGSVLEGRHLCLIFARQRPYKFHRVYEDYVPLNIPLCESSTEILPQNSTDSSAALSQSCTNYPNSVACSLQQQPTAYQHFGSNVGVLNPFSSQDFLNQYYVRNMLYPKPYFFLFSPGFVINNF
ncbi:polyadenylate-binding protein 4-like [Morus notabilis]|uniref:polyadenylate-binding protein 4-like n=1 Tax=Morus notabilis TaxID=981085 RepID=UPI000CED0FC3|nr:polyadenylate-binding protein 4-like [Morus notabilis]